MAHLDIMMEKTSQLTVQCHASNLQTSILKVCGLGLLVQIEHFSLGLRKTSHGHADECSMSCEMNINRLIERLGTGGLHLRRIM